MKKKREWNSDEELRSLIENMSDELGGFPPDMSRCEIAELVGVTPNGKFYRVYDSWKQSCREDAAATVVEIPQHALSGFDVYVDLFTKDLRQEFITLVRRILSEIYGAAELRVADAEQRARREQEEREDLLKILERTEEERDDALRREKVWSEKAHKLQRDKDRLYGRLEEQAAQNAVARAANESADEEASDRPRTLREIAERTGSVPRKSSMAQAPDLEGQAAEASSSMATPAPEAEAGHDAND